MNNRNKKKTLSEVKASLEQGGYTLISSSYSNCKSKLFYRCKKGHINSMTWTSWQQGKRCPECSSRSPLSIDFIIDKLNEDGYTLLTHKYINSKQLLECLCNNGHKCIIRWNDWQQGHRCGHCNGNKPLTIDDVKLHFDSEGYSLLTDRYSNSRSELWYVCPNGHRHKTNMSGWINKVRCPSCHILGLYGPGNPSWKGGVSFEPYCSEWKDMEYKDSIKSRDNYKCLNPYCDSEDKTDLVVHHIDYNKKNCKPTNLVTVCRSCNAKANKDREWHAAWYTSILRQRYNY